MYVKTKINKKPPHLPQVIFDGGASRRVRQEALSFMMDHTEGFEVITVTK